MALTTITHKGKTIYFNDWRGLKQTKDFVPKIEEGNQNTLDLIEQGKTDILTLTDVTDSYVFGEALELLKKAGKTAKAITRKSATVGLTSSKRILLNSLNRFADTNVKAFDTIEEARDWLVKD